MSFGNMNSHQKIIADLMIKLRIDYIEPNRAPVLIDLPRPNS